MSPVPEGRVRELIERRGAAELTEEVRALLIELLAARERVRLLAGLLREATDTGRTWHPDSHFDWLSRAREALAP